MTDPSAIDAEISPPSGGAEGGVVWRVLQAHWSMTGATRAVLASRPGEARLLILVVAASLIPFVARSIEIVMSGADTPIARIGASFVALIVVGIPAFYVVAALTRLIASLFGGEASWRESRAAVFWAALAAAPVVFATTLASAALAEHGAVANAIELAGSAYFGYAFCVAVAIANKFRTSWGVFGVTAAVLTVIFGGLWLLLGGAA